MANSLDGMIRGAVPLARVIFRDPRKRKLIPRLQQEGWPIFDFAGKPSAFPTDLAPYIRRTREAARRRQRKGARAQEDAA